MAAAKKKAATKKRIGKPRRHLFANAQDAAMIDALAKEYGPATHEIFRRISESDAKGEIDAVALSERVTPFFRVLFRSPRLPLWPADFLEVVGLLSWDYPPFSDAVRLLHNQAQLPRRRNQSPVELAPREAGKRRLSDSNSPMTWEYLKEQPAELQDVYLGALRFPLFGGAGTNEDDLDAVGDVARKELVRVLMVDVELIRNIRPYVSIRHIRTLRQYERMRDEGASSDVARRRIAEAQRRTRTAIDGDIQRAMNDIGLTQQKAASLRSTRRVAQETGEPPSPPRFVLDCPDHHKPMNEWLACDDCRSEAETFRDY